MAVVDAGALPGRGRSVRNLILVGLVVASVAVGLRFADSTGLPQIQTFLLVFGSLLIEAMPFILLGAVVSAGIEVFVPARAFSRVARLPRWLQMPLAGLGGFAFPVCECGSVPVARRLAAKGLAPAAAVTFMLAAPILNPVVLVATAVAYRGREALWTMVAGRAVLGLVAAMAVGWVVARRSSVELLKGNPVEHDHHHEELAPATSRWRGFFGQLAEDFVMLSRYLVVGAAVAAALQTFVPQDAIGAVAATPVLNIVAMMALAGVLSLCSESDAFVAASFVQFGVGAQLAFLVFGPMVDTKLGFLYAGTFNRGFLRVVIAVVAAVTLAGTMWIEVLAG
jgi:uncharacterized membrane protein YraQ (UPF0718 family)